MRFESEEEEEKKNDSEKFLRAREKAQNIFAHSFRFFLSLSFSFSPVVVVVVVACHHPERERERERGARISSKTTLLVSRFAKHTCVCSLSVLSLLL